jgi:hypothetical protein
LWRWLEKVESGWAFYGIGPLISGDGYSSVLTYVQSLCKWLEKFESGWAFYGIGPLRSGDGYSSVLT